MSQPKLAVVLKGYPRLSETFIAQELLNLERSGFSLMLVSLRYPTDSKTHPIHDEIIAPLLYLPEYLYRQPLRVLRGWWRARRLAGYGDARSAFIRDLKRDLSTNRIRRFGQALVLANELNEEFPALYAHFLHTPASVARYAAIMLRLPWACSAHAKDIYTSPNWEIAEKLAECEWLTTCTRANAEHLSALADQPAKVMLNYHGLDLQRFSSEKPVFSDRDGMDAGAPAIILSVGRTVEKKGYTGLIQAMAKLPRELHWRFHHIGGGPLLNSLRRQAQSLGIADRIQWHGAQSQETVLKYYRQADLFVLNSCVDRHGDRDGLPNVMVEAQSQGLPVIGTTLSGIPELVEQETNGLLVEPGDTGALTGALERLIRLPSLREQFGRAGRTKVQNEFEMQQSFSMLHRKLVGLVAR